MFIKKAIIVSCCMLTAIAVYSQEAEIKKMLAGETESYYKRDLSAWLANWAQDASTARVYMGSFGYFTQLGWDSIQAQETRNFNHNPQPDSVQITTDSFTIRKEGSMAIVDFKQTVLYLKSQAPFDKSTSVEHRELVKKNGKWKITKQVTTDLTGYGESGSELALNGIGYDYLFSGKTDEAIEVLSLNAKLHPNSYNVFDSLGEAYAKAGQKELAIENYKKSLELNPNSETGKKALETLK
jgi:tetratricopeptide (TPR) repeat protein